MLSLLTTCAPNRGDVLGDAMKQFVPVSDDEFEAMMRQQLRPVPYQVGVPCHHGLVAGAVSSASGPQRWNSTTSPGLTPSLSAVPALSSSTY
jgi:hypothetical protein